MRSAIMLGLALILMVFGVESTLAQEDSVEVSRRSVAQHRDWNVFVEESPRKQCWSVSQPTESVHTRDGRVVAVRRGEIRLHIIFIPEINVLGQVSFASGYPFREGSSVTVEIDGQRFEMFTLGELAWTNSDEDDKKMVEALKLGKEAVVTGVSGRGTTTKDTFSLLGVTAAIEDAQRRCDG